MFPVLECDDLIMKKSYIVLPCNFPCFLGPGPYRSVSSIFYMCSVILSWLLYPSGQVSTKDLFSCCGWCLVPDLNVVSFN